MQRWSSTIGRWSVLAAMCAVMKCAASGGGTETRPAGVEPCEADSGSFLLSNGVSFPAVSFGAAALFDRCEEIIGMALDAGFRAFDTAQSEGWYNETAVGQAIANHPTVQRKDVFVTSKMHTDSHGYDYARRKVSESLVNLNGGDKAAGDHSTFDPDVHSPIDLYLIHDPDSEEEPEDGSTWLDSWRGLEAEYKAGRIRTIGVSNFDEELLTELLREGTVRPHVTQDWMDPANQAKSLRAFCEKENIHFTSYATLGGNWVEELDRNIILESPTIKYVAREAGLSVATTVLAWALQRGASVLPRSSNRRHIADNAKMFGSAPPRLTNEQLQLIDDLDGRIDFHPECPGWAQDGECDTNPNFMLAECRESCGDDVAEGWDEEAEEL